MPPKKRWGASKSEAKEESSPVKTHLPVRQRVLDMEDAIVMYFENVWNGDEAFENLRALRDASHLPWSKKLIITPDGKESTENRFTCFFSDRPDLVYAYSGRDNQSTQWTPELLEIKKRVEDFVRDAGLGDWHFNCALANRYDSGKHTLGFHADNEPDLDPNAPIASVSFGSTRRFEFKRRNDPTPHVESLKSVMLTDGSLLVMAGETQRHWLHAVPASPSNDQGMRINLTFRVIQDRKLTGYQLSAEDDARTKKISDDVTSQRILMKPKGPDPFAGVAEVVAKSSAKPVQSELPPPPAAVGAETAAPASRFPEHWGEPPLRQTRDLRELPGGYGMGSGTLATWITEKMAADAAGAETAAPASRFPEHWGEPPLRQTRDLRELPGGYGMGSGTLATWITEKMAADANEQPVPTPGAADFKPPNETLSTWSNGSIEKGSEYSILRRDPNQLERKPEREPLRSPYASAIGEKVGAVDSTGKTSEELDREPLRNPCAPAGPVGGGQEASMAFLIGSQKATSSSHAEARLADDGNAYSKEEFFSFYGSGAAGRAKWDAAKKVQTNGSVSEDWPEQVSSKHWDSYEDEERRYDRSSGIQYTKTEFIAYYGDLKEWNAAKPANFAPIGSAKAVDHHREWGGYSQAPQRRQDEYGNWYTKQEFIDFYGGTKEWFEAEAGNEKGKGKGKGRKKGKGK